MAIRSGFFNSVNGDRKYDAKRFAEYFASFIGNGIFPNPSDCLQVISNNDMTITVRPGKAWINGYILINDDDYILEIEPADGVLNRIDRIVARYDVVDREIRLEVKKGTFASEPTAPDLQRDTDAYELALADVYIAAGVVSVTQANITDLRLNNELCGIVHGTVEQVDTTTLFNQYVDWYTTTTGQAETDIEAIKQQFQAEFDAWFAGIKDILDESTAGNLLNLIEEHKNDTNNPHNVTTEQIGAETPVGAQAKVNNHAEVTSTISTLGHVYEAEFTVTIAAASWSGTTPPYSNAVTVNGITPSHNPIIDVIMSGAYSTDQQRCEQWGNIYRATTSSNTITFYAHEKPTIDLPIRVKVVM